MKEEKDWKKMWIKYVLLLAFGVGAGVAIAGGFFALLIALGIISRFAHETRTGAYLWVYETVMAAGAIFGTAWYLYGWKFPIGKIGLGIYGVGAGIFVGAWTMALTEIIDTIPIFMRRIYLKRGLVAIVWSLAVGHSAGSLLHIFLWG